MVVDGRLVSTRRACGCHQLYIFALDLGSEYLKSSLGLTPKGKRVIYTRPWWFSSRVSLCFGLRTVSNRRPLRKEWRLNSRYLHLIRSNAHPWSFLVLRNKGYHMLFSTFALLYKDYLIRNRPIWYYCYDLTVSFPVSGLYAPLQACGYILYLIGSKRTSCKLLLLWGVCFWRCVGKVRLLNNIPW